MQRLPAPGEGGPSLSRDLGVRGTLAPCRQHASPLFFGWNAHRKRQELREGGDQTVAQQVWSRTPPYTRARPSLSP